jgi:two-component system sensor kinase FixL
VATLAFLDSGFPPVLSPDEIASIGVFVLTSTAMLSFTFHLRALRDRERQLEAALQQQRTDSAMGTMAATLAHELNQPLAAAANYVGAGKHMAASLQGDRKVALIGGLDEAETQILRAGDIIRHARHLVSSASAQCEPTSLLAMIESMTKPLQASGACQELKLRIDIDPRADEVFVNRIQIEQVLLNLIRNACQATGFEEETKLSITGKLRDEFVLVEVRDYGPGVSSNRLETLFSPGAKPSDGGLGLGLSISRTIIEFHGGRIWAENKLEGGASFFFTVPAAHRPI